MKILKIQGNFYVWERHLEILFYHMNLFGFRFCEKFRLHIFWSGPIYDGYVFGKNIIEYCNLVAL